MWHQGEADRTQPAAYHDNLRQLVSYLRACIVEKTGDPSYATLPFIAGTVNRNSTQYNAVVEQAVLQLATEDPNFHVVDMSDCKLGSDVLHFDASGSVDAAQRMFEKLKSLGLLEEEDPTGVPSLPAEGCMNGSNVCYDLQGRQVANGNPANGNLPNIYIRNGRKVLNPSH
jgi:hypothetical protein